MKAAIEKSKFHNVEFSVDEFHGSLKRLLKDEIYRSVEAVGKVYGYKSEQFLFAVQGFVYWLVYRYVRIEVSEEDLKELLQNVWCCLLERMEEYDERKGKFVSWIYTLVRGEITKFLYDKTRSLRFISLDRDVYENENGSDLVFYKIYKEGKEGAMNVSGDVGIEDLEGEERRLLEEMKNMKFKDEIEYRKKLWDIYKKHLTGEEYVK